MMTPQKELFVKEYLVDLNATQAAIRAGYSPKTAGSQGQRLLKDVEIAEAVAQAKTDRAEKVGITAERVLNELAKIGFANMADYITITENGDPFINLAKCGRDQLAVLSEATVKDVVEGRREDARTVREVKIKLYDKRAALVDLGKHLGIFSEKTEHTGTIQVVYGDDPVAQPASWTSDGPSAGEEV